MNMLSFKFKFIAGCCQYSVHSEKVRKARRIGSAYKNILYTDQLNVNRVNVK